MFIKQEFNFVGCEAKFFWLLVRHGTRNPGDDDIWEMKTRGVEVQEAIITNHNQGRGNIPTFIHQQYYALVKFPNKYYTFTDR